MKVSIIHAERRTQQIVSLDGKDLPKKLGPTQRHELRLAHGAYVEFFARAGVKKHGTVPLLIELEAEEGETLAEGVVRTADAFGDGTFEVPISAPLNAQGAYGCVRLDLRPGADLLVVIANPVPQLQLSGE